MRILMRNSVFRTAALAGLFLCMLMLAGVFSGTADFVHASHDETPAITANQVQTEAQLEQFVKEAVDAYYIDFIIKHHCDFSSIPEAQGIDVSALPTATIKSFIPQFSGLALEDICDLDQDFEDVFGREDGDWKSGSIYLFIMDGNGNMLYHGVDENFEGEPVIAVDEGGRDVGELIVDEAENPMNAGIVQYCWDDPTTEDDNIDDNDPATAPGDSLKTSYVVDPFAELGINPPMGSPGVIFGSGIYPGMDDQFPACDGNGMADGGMQPEPMQPEPMQPEPMQPEPMQPEPGTGMPTSVSGGGCAIAAGSNSTPGNNAFNLLLITSVLLFTVSFGSRAAGRRNRISS